MYTRNVSEVSQLGMCVGLGIATIPALATTLIACSKIILINIIADTIFRMITFNQYTLTVHNLSLISVPLLWKFSKITAILGGAILAISGLAALTTAVYQRYDYHS